MIKFLLLGFLFIFSVAAWGQEGHKIIGAIAWDRLSSATQNIVQKVISPDSLEKLAPLADDYCHIPQGAWSCPCHYVNCPRGATSFDLSRDCPTGVCCVVKAINNYTSIINQNSGQWPVCNYNLPHIPCPAEFLVHFTGDVHQPLHVGYGYDRGGNEVSVTWYGSPTNLHSVWDDKIIETWQYYTSDAISELQQYISDNQAQVSQWAASTNVNDWANESFYYVRTVVYRFNSSSPVNYDSAAPSANANLVGAWQPTLGDWYYAQNLPIVKQRLAQAAVRLAVRLQTLFGN